VLPPVIVAPVEIIEPVNKDRRYFVAKIVAAWQKTTESIIDTGRLLIEAKAKIEHGEFEDMIDAQLPFGPRAARMLMAIAANPVLSDRNHGSVLPPSWRTLYELSRLDGQVLLARIEDHSVNPGMERKDVTLIAGGGHKTKLRRISKANERIIELSGEIKSLKDYYDAQIEAARDSGFSIDDDEAELARKIIMVIGKDRAELLIVELKKAIATLEAA
jgi:hypothetical protein